MQTRCLEFNGISYECRVVFDGEVDCLIAPESLFYAIYSDDFDKGFDGFVNEEAMFLDDLVYCYIDDDDINLPDEDLIKLLK